MKVRKRFVYGEKRKAWYSGKLTQMPVSVTEGLGVTDEV